MRLDGNPIIGSFVNDEGLNIKTYEWNSKEPIGIILLIHGFNSSLRLEYMLPNVKIINEKHVDVLDKDNYYIYSGSWINELNNANYTVCGIELQGHGESEGLNNRKLDVNEFDNYVNDIIKYMHIVNGKYNCHEKEMTSSTTIIKKKIPFYIMGLSMGGNLTLRTIQLLQKSETKEAINIKGCIILAGMLSFKHLTDQWFNRCVFFPTVKILRKYLPTLRITPKVNFTLYKYVNEIFKNDPYIHKGRATCRLGCELLNAVEKLETDICYIPKDLPLLFFHSTKDTLCSFEGAQIFFKKIDNNKKKFIVLENMEHLLTLEPGNEENLKQILKWLSEISKDI